MRVGQLEGALACGSPYESVHNFYQFTLRGARRIVELVDRHGGCVQRFCDILANINIRGKSGDNLA
jgi:hypothetical protein